MKQKNKQIMNLPTLTRAGQKERKAEEEEKEKENGGKARLILPMNPKMPIGVSQANLTRARKEKVRIKEKKVHLLQVRRKEKAIPRARIPLLPVRLSNRVSQRIINRPGMRRPGGLTDGTVLTGTERLGDF